MSKKSKKDCLDLIKNKKLQYEIRMIAQTNRLVSIAITDGRRSVSEPIFSWDRLFDKLSAMESDVIDTVDEEKPDDTIP